MEIIFRQYGSSDSSDEEAMLLIGIVVASEKDKRQKNMWVRDYLKKREGSRAFQLVQETAMFDKEMFHRYMRMSPSAFEELLSLVATKTTKKTTNYRIPIPPEQRLSLTIRHLATGESQVSLSFQYRIGRQTVSKIIPETCIAIYEALAPIHLKKPDSSEQWIQISKGFENKWNMPHVIGALDGKHVRIRCPNNSGSFYHNYKGFFSMVLMAICDAHYRFIMFDFGQYGSNNDSGILINSAMGKQLEQNALGIPSAACLDGCKYDPLPYFLVGDEIFPLKTYLMRPYPGSDITESESV